MNSLFFQDWGWLLQEYPQATLLATFFYSFMHILPFSIIRCYIFRKYLRYPVWQIAAGASFIYLCECLLQLAAGKIFSTRVALPIHAIYFCYFTVMIKLPLVKQLALSLPLVPLMLFALSLAYTIEYHFPLFPVPYFEAGLVLVIFVAVIFLPIRKYSRLYIEPLLASSSLDNLWRYILSMSASLLLISLMTNPFNESQDVLLLAGRLISLVGSFGCISIILYVIQQTVKHRQLNAKIVIAREMQNIEQQHFTKLAEIETQTQLIRQQLSKHVEHFNVLLSQQDYPALQAYAQGLLAQERLLKTERVCGNELVNAIISYWRAELDRLQVQCKINVFLGPVNPIAPLHLTVLLGNLLKNACEALAQVPVASERQLHLYLKQVHGWLLLTVDNTYYGRVRFDDEGRLLSAKRNYAERGIGLDSIYHSVEVCGGRIEIKTEDIFFRTLIVLPLTIKEEHPATKP